MIHVNNFTKTYHDFVAVRNLTFNVEAGEILGLVGPNGAGKTTMIRTLSGIIPPSSGTLSVAGHDIVSDAVMAKRALGYIPDDPRLFDSLTVWEHLEFIAATYGVDHFKPAAESLLRFFNLEGKRNHVVQSLSRGMRQKVAIACAYLHRPDVILFDEPLTGLDPAGIRAIKESMQQQAAQGAAIIISSHLLELVESLCSHLLVLHQGQCRYFGRMEDVLQVLDHANGDASLEDVFFSITHSDNPDLGSF
ncbi:ABC transporter ATP-binding protein [Methylomarinum sp. Ch1-1]|uniref:ABC transporter ATP-binding protein n=1 Tax=Methylomarinum roseum TaxID=3067653 RepID=A0AAU7NV02_9GAMM